MTIVSIDFETANSSDVSICAAGLAVFEDGRLSQSLHRLVRPPKGYGWFREDFIECHGLTWFDVRDAPEFPAIAPDLLPPLSRADLVIAHHAAFDLRKLHGTSRHFGLECPAFDYLCTLQLSRRVWPDLPNHRLDTLARHVGHEFQHHNAQEDAEAAGRIFYAMMRSTKAATPMDLLSALGITVSRRPAMD